MEQKSRGSFKWLLLGIFLLSTSVIVFSMYLETSSFVVNLALKKNGKTYLFSKTGTAGVQYSLDKNKSPSVFGFIQLFEEEDSFYVDPIHIEEITNLLCGNYVLHDYTEQSYNGYVTSGKQRCFKNTFKNQSTATIGEQIRLNTIQLTDSTSESLYEINWEYNLMEYKSRALENCEEKSFMITTQIQPGEAVMGSEDFIMVNLEDLVEFYGNTSSLRLDEKQRLLYIIQE